MWRCRWVLIAGGIFLLLLLVGALAGDPEQQSQERAGDEPTATPTQTRTPSPTPDPAAQARAEAAQLIQSGRYQAAVVALEDAGLDGAADVVRRRGSRALYRRARRAMTSGRYVVARQLAFDARRLRRTREITAFVAEAGTQIAAARAAARERRRQARIARDLATCSSSEKDTVHVGGGTPGGCETYAANLQARRAEREARRQTQQAEWPETLA